MANSIVQTNAGIVAKGLAQTISDNLKFCSTIAKADETDYDGKNGYSSGNTIYLAKPARFIPQDSFDITSSVQDVKEEKVPLVLDIIKTVGIKLNSQELAHDFNLKSIIKRVNDQAGVAIAHGVEQEALKRAIQGTANLVGTAGSTTFGIDTILSAREKMGKYLCPADNNRTLLLDGTASRSAVNARSSLFNSSKEISNQYVDGMIGRADGFNWFESELLYDHTNGNDVTGVTVAVTSVTGATTLAVSGLTITTGTVKKGQVFTIAGVFAVHPQTRTARPFLQQFVVTADATADGSGNATISVSPTIYGSGSGSLQNVSALPTSSSALVFVGVASTAYTQSFAYHKNAFRFVSVPLEMPSSAEFAAQATVDNITVAIIRAFDVKTREWITRVDFLGGLALERPEWACRITA